MIRRHCHARLHLRNDRGKTRLGFTFSEPKLRAMGRVGTNRPMTAATIVICFILCALSIVATGPVSSANGIFKPPEWDARDCTRALKEYGKDACFSSEDPYFGFRKYSKENIIRPPNFKPKRWLQIVIGTIPRKNNLPYLARTVRALRDQLPHPKTKDPFSNGAAHVKVVNFRPKSHVVFDRISKEFQGHAKGKDS